MRAGRRGRAKILARAWNRRQAAQVDARVAAGDVRSHGRYFEVAGIVADRKAGHMLRDGDGKLWSIDHGLCFNVVPKVRTVLLHFCGERVPDAVLEDLTRFRSNKGLLAGVCAALRPLIEDEELDAFMRRLDWVLERKVYPSLDPYRSVPWPPF